MSSFLSAIRTLSHSSHLGASAARTSIRPSESAYRRFTHPSRSSYGSTYPLHPPSEHPEQWSIYRCSKCQKNTVAGKIEESKIQALAVHRYISWDEVRSSLGKKNLDDKMINHLLQAPGDYRFLFSLNKVEIVKASKQDPSTARITHEKNCDSAFKMRAKDY